MNRGSAFSLFLTFFCSAAQAAPEPSLMLCYHRFGPEKASDSYQISLSRFDEQLAWLAEKAPGKIEISIDDGYASGFEAAAVLEKHGLHATFFVYPGSIGRKKWLTWTQLRELERRGHTVASHTLTHPNLATPEKGESAAAFRARVRKELRESKQRLEEKLGHEVSSLAYPYGAYDRWVEAEAKAAGYLRAYTVSGGAMQPDDPPLRLRRFLVMGQPSLKAFQKSVERQFLPRAEAAGVEEGGLYVEGSLPDSLPDKRPGFHFFKSGSSQFLYHVVRQDQAAYFELSER